MAIGGMNLPSRLIGVYDRVRIEPWNKSDPLEVHAPEVSLKTPCHEPGHRKVLSLGWKVLL